MFGRWFGESQNTPSKTTANLNDTPYVNNQDSNRVPVDRRFENNYRLNNNHPPETTNGTVYMTNFVEDDTDEDLFNHTPMILPQSDHLRDEDSETNISEYEQHVHQSPFARTIAAHSEETSDSSDEDEDPSFNSQSLQSSYKTQYSSESNSLSNGGARRPLTRPSRARMLKRKYGNMENDNTPIIIKKEKPGSKQLKPETPQTSQNNIDPSKPLTSKGETKRVKTENGAVIKTEKLQYTPKKSPSSKNTSSASKPTLSEKSSSSTTKTSPKTLKFSSLSSVDSPLEDNTNEDKKITADNVNSLLEFIRTMVKMEVSKKTTDEKKKSKDDEDGNEDEDTEEENEDKGDDEEDEDEDYEEEDEDEDYEEETEDEKDSSNSGSEDYRTATKRKRRRSRRYRRSSSPKPIVLNDPNNNVPRGTSESVPLFAPGKREDYMQRAFDFVELYKNRLNMLESNPEFRFIKAVQGFANVPMESLIVNWQSDVVRKQRMVSTSNIEMMAKALYYLDCDLQSSSKKDPLKDKTKRRTKGGLLDDPDVKDLGMEDLFFENPPPASRDVYHEVREYMTELSDYARQIYMRNAAIDVVRDMLSAQHTGELQHTGALNAAIIEAELRASQYNPILSGAKVADYISSDNHAMSLMAQLVAHHITRSGLLAPRRDTKMVQLPAINNAIKSVLAQMMYLKWGNDPIDGRRVLLFDHHMWHGIRQERQNMVTSIMGYSGMGSSFSSYPTSKSTAINALVRAPYGAPGTYPYV